MMVHPCSHPWWFKFLIGESGWKMIYMYGMVSVSITNISLVMLIAALKVATYLPIPYSALSIFLVVPAPIRDAVYDFVAKRRYGWFGKSSECIIPTEDVLDRFVDKLEIQEKLALEEEDDEEQRDEKAWSFCVISMVWYMLGIES